MSEGFSISDSKGFTVTFDNGVTVSVQFGGGNYCSRYDEQVGGERDGRHVFSHDAEIAIIGPKGGPDRRPWLTKAWDPDHDDDVMGWVSPAKVFDALAWAKAYDPMTADSGLAPVMSPLGRESTQDG